MNNDKPIFSKNQDELQRKRFIEAAVHQIESIDDSSCFIVGLYGQWGLGKTSIVNLIREELKTKKYYTAYFNPWIFRSEDTLLIELFNTIIRGCNSDERLKSRLSDIGGALKKYAEFIKLPKVGAFGVEIDGSEMVQSSIKGIGTFLDGQPTLEEQKNATNQVLRGLNNPLIIFIDDVDRLDREEVRLLFKTIKLTADFDKVVYILAFDEEIVAKSLGGYYGAGREEDGKRFIEKIVQLPIRIPELSVEAKLNYTLKLLDKWEVKNSLLLPTYDREEYINRLRSIHQLFIKTPRDSKRLVNAFSFAEKSLRGEVNYFDLVIIEALRLFNPSLYDFLKDNREWLFSGLSSFKLDISTFLGTTETKSNHYALKYIIDWLFPYNNLTFSTESKSTENTPLEFFDAHNKLELRKGNLTKFQNIGSRPYFLKYIEFNIGPEQIPDVLFKEVLTAFESKQYSELSGDINKMSFYSPKIIYDKFEVFENELTELGKINFIKLLFLNDSFESFFYLMREDTRHVGFIIRKCNVFFKDTSNFSDIQDLFLVIIQDCKYLHVLPKLINSLEFGFELKEDLGSIIVKVPNLNIEKIKSAFLRRIMSTPIENFFIKPAEFKNWDLFGFIERVGNINRVKTKIEKWVRQEPSNALLLIKSLASMVKTGNEVYYNNEISDDTFIEIENYCSRISLKKALNNIYKNIDLSITEADEPGKFHLREANESIATQYLRFVKKVEKQEEISAKIERVLNNLDS